MSIKGKVALITGSSRGIGRETATYLASKGCHVIIHYSQNKELAQLVQANIQKKYKVKTLVLQADISKEEEVSNMVEKGIETFGRIDILVNNAGICIDSFFEDKTVENFRKTLDVNVVGTFLVSKYVGKHMMQQKYGKIVNVSSNNALHAYCPMSIDYDASKAAVISLTHNLSLQFAPYVNVNAIAPGWVKTDMTAVEDAELEEMFETEECKKIYLGRFASPREIASTIAFLVSEEASYINNAIINVDGGYE